MNWRRKQKAIEERGNYRVTMDQNEMDFLNPTGYADSYKGALAIKRRAMRRSTALTYSIEKKDERGFWQKVRS